MRGKAKYTFLPTENDTSPLQQFQKTLGHCSYDASQNALQITKDLFPDIEYKVRKQVRDQHTLL